MDFFSNDSESPLVLQRGTAPAGTGTFLQIVGNDREGYRQVTRQHQKESEVPRGLDQREGRTR